MWSYPLALAAYLDDAPRNTHLIERRDLTHVRLNVVTAAPHPVHAVYDAALHLDLTYDASLEGLSKRFAAAPEGRSRE